MRIITILRLGASLLLAGPFGAHAAVYTAGDSTPLIFDGSSNAGAELPLLPALSVARPDERVSDVNIRLDFAKCASPGWVSGAGCPNAADAFSSEIYFYLLSPAGTRVDLVWTYAALPEGFEQESLAPEGTYPGPLNAGGRHQVGFDDQAAAAVGPLLLNGSFRPAEPLSAFTDEDPQGSWRLGIGDSILADPLSYFGACLSVATDGSPNGFGACAFGNLPAPGSLPLALAGLGVLASRRARRRPA